MQALRRSVRRIRWLRLPAAVWILLAVATLAAVNLVVQIVRKPAEILSVAPDSRTPPALTWRTYGHLFREHATEIVSAEFLAALVQAESAGDPFALVSWRWRWSWNPFEIYAPASSAVGLLQITDGNFEEARRLCIHDHAVARVGPWHDPRSCWFNGLYARWVPSHAVEMTSAFLHVAVGRVVASHGRSASASDLRRLATVIHLCGPGRGARFARHGFRVAPGERCGTHDLADYLARVAGLERLFARLQGR